MKQFKKSVLLCVSFEYYCSFAALTSPSLGYGLDIGKLFLILGVDRISRGGGEITVAPSRIWCTLGFRGEQGWSKRESAHLPSLGSGFDCRT